MTDYRVGYTMSNQSIEGGHRKEDIYQTVILFALRLLKH